MKKGSAIVWSCLFLLSFATAALANSDSGDPVKKSIPSAIPAWEASLLERNIDGWFDYSLYYPGRYQLLSKVSFPQNQKMKVFEIRHRLADDGFYIRFNYGQSGAGFKGKGSDSDWTVAGSNSITDYGDFDVYGDQSLVVLDLGKVLTRSEHQRTELFLGVIRQDTTNELRNVVYYRLNGMDIDALPQEDLGSTLQGRFHGIRLGVQNERHWSKWSLTGEIGLTAIQTTAYGHWANHDPAWDWVDSGYAVGWTADASLRYSIDRHIRVELGYFSGSMGNLFGLSACDETITGEGLDPNGESILDQVILGYAYQGFRIGLSVLF